MQASGSVLRLFSATAIALVSVFLGGCETATPVNNRGSLPKTAALLQAGSTDATAILRQMEEELMAAPAVRAKADILSLGHHQASLQGLLYFGPENSGAFDFGGSFAGKTAILKLTEMGGEIWGGNNGTAFKQVTPKEYRASLVLGMTRVGLLHNLALLANGKAPEHAEGGVAQWATAEELRVTGEKPIAGGLAVSLEYKILVSGREVGEAVLWIDKQNGMPLSREQKIHFPEGDMSVSEYYVMEVRWSFKPAKLPPSSK